MPSPRCGMTARTRHTVDPCTTASHGSAPRFASPRVRMRSLPSRRDTDTTRCVTTGRPGSGAWNDRTWPGWTADTGSLTSTTTASGGIVGRMLPVSIVTVR